MSLTQSNFMTTFEDQQVADKQGNVQMKKVKITTRYYPCRPQVLQRRQWKKFGQVENIPRGQHKKGDFTQTDIIKFENDQGQVEEELDMVKQIKQISKQSMMMRTLRK